MPLQQAAEGHLDLTSFRHFAPLLVASQEYADESGYRFRSTSFRTVFADAGESEDAGATEETEARQAVRLRATPMVRTFMERLRGGDAALQEELESAFRFVMAESVRNSMLSAFRRFDLWPPRPPPRGIEEDDCAYQDVSTALPVIAQRLYNDEVRRTLDASLVGGSMGQAKRRALTAAYLVDFAQACCVDLPPMPVTQALMLEEFQCRVAEWETEHSPHAGRKAEIPESGAEGGKNAAAQEAMQESLNQWLNENRRAVLWTAAGVALVGPVATAGVFLARRAWQGRSGGGAEAAEVAEAMGAPPPQEAAVAVESSGEAGPPTHVTAIV